MKKFKVKKNIKRFKVKKNSIGFQINLLRHALVDMSTGKVTTVTLVKFPKNLKGGCKKQLYKTMKQLKSTSATKYQQKLTNIVQKMDPHRGNARVWDETKDMIRRGHLIVRKKAA